MGIMSSLNKRNANRVIGIDASTKSLAFAVFDDGKPINCGQVFFTGSTVFERLKDAKKKTRTLVKAGILKGDIVAIESAVMVRSVQVAIDMAYVFGVILGELGEGTKDLRKVAPISWQTGIGNPNLKKAEKDKIRKDFPDKSNSWYQAKGREIRKKKTLDIAKQYFSIPNDSDDISDAVGISLFVTKTLTNTSCK